MAPATCCRGPHRGILCNKPGPEHGVWDRGVEMRLPPGGAGLDSDQRHDHVAGCRPPKEACGERLPGHHDYTSVVYPRNPMYPAMTVPRAPRVPRCGCNDHPMVALL